MNRKRIFVFINSGAGTQFVMGTALCEDGVFLAGHCSSNETWFRHDMGLDGSNWQHDKYAAHCPEGYELVDLEGDVTRDPEVMAAYALHLKSTPEEKKEDESAA